MRALEYKSELTIEFFAVLLDHTSEFIQLTVTSLTDAKPRQNLGARGGGWAWYRRSYVKPALR